VAEGREHPVRRTLEGLAANDPAHGDDRGAALASGDDPVPEPGHCEDRADRDDRVRRGDDDRLRRVERATTSPRVGGRRDPAKRTSRTGRAQPDE
jgi:hypothetical protein